MQLDFSAIRGDTALDMAAEAHIKPTEQSLAIKRGNTKGEEKELDLSRFRAITEAPRKQEQAAGLAIFYQREQQELDRAREVYKSYQNNIRAAGSCRSDILKGIKRGEEPLALLLKAVECISLMTGDTAIYAQGKADLQTIYGWGLGYTAPLQTQLQEATDRLYRLESAKVEPLEEPRLQGAIRAHRELITDLERAIARAEREEGHKKTLPDLTPQSGI